MYQYNVRRIRKKGSTAYEYTVFGLLYVRVSVLGIRLGTYIKLTTNLNEKVLNVK